MSHEFTLSPKTTARWPPRFRQQKLDSVYHRLYTFGSPGVRGVPTRTFASEARFASFLALRRIKLYGTQVYRALGPDGCGSDFIPPVALGSDQSYRHADRHSDGFDRRGDWRCHHPNYGNLYFHWLSDEIWA